MTRLLRSRIWGGLLMVAALAVIQPIGAEGASGKPTLTSLNPASTTAGSPTFILTIYGSGFVAGSTVVWAIGSSNTSLTPSSTSSTTIWVSISYALLASPGTATVMVNNPGRNGGLSNGLYFTISPPTTTITTAPLAISTTSIPAGTQGTAYSTTLTATGGTTPYSWKVSSGSLPSGLLLGTTGAISGTPTVSGTFSLTAQASDSAGHTASHTYSLAVGASTTTSTLSISTASPLPNATVSTAYSSSFAATGGTSPYGWSVASGSTLPAGLSLSSTGNLSGTPTSATTYTFSVQVRDALSNTSTKSYSLTVSTSTTTHKVVLSWSAPTAISGVTITGFNVYRLDVTSTTTPSTCPTPSSTSSFTMVGNTTSLSYTDTSVTGGHTYCYYGTALAGAVESAPSNISTPTSVPSP